MGTSARRGRTPHEDDIRVLAEEENEIVEARGVLKNILCYGLGDRLENIRNVPPAFEKSRVRRKGPTVRVGMSTVAPSEAGSKFRFFHLHFHRTAVGFLTNAICSTPSSPFI
jgi:hypothetical protein